MITLGINAAFHDSSAALVRDGCVIAAAEEERFRRIKHAKRPVPFSAWELPFHAIDYCLSAADLRLVDVDWVAYSFDPQRFAGERLDVAAHPQITLPLAPSAAPLRDNDWDNPWDPLFVSSVVNAPRQLADGAPLRLRARLRGARADGPYRFRFVEHHVAHQASAFLAAPMTRCAVMTLDGRGERATTSYGHYHLGRYTPLGEVEMPHSLGLLYERITAHLGFEHSSDEYKVMALAAMGTPRFLPTLRRLVTVGEHGQYRVAAFDPAEEFCALRRPGEPLEPVHRDLAASLQAILEETVLKLADWLAQATGERQLAMAGGVALNCVMNARLRDSGLFDLVWVQPAAGDAGTALGAALWVDAQERREADGRLPARRWTMQDAYLGPSYPDAAVEALLREARLPYRRMDSISEDVARLLAQDAIVGWFQGRMEFGPRALGARSILASPRSAAMQQRLNQLKAREEFRPVAPVVPIDDLAEWFEPGTANGGSAPFMTFLYRVRADRVGRIPSACHVDGTARVQTVTRESNAALYDLLKAVGARTGAPVLINTSFNARGEPIVSTPEDALAAFFTTPLDALAIGPFLIEKPRRP